MLRYSVASDTIFKIFPSVPENISQSSEELNVLRIACLICHEAQVAQDSLVVF